MRLLLSSVLAIHWMAVFAMLAIVTTIAPARGSLSALELLGVHHSGVDFAGSEAFAAVLSLVFATVSALFLWTFLVAALEAGRSRDADEVARYAFTGGVFALTTLLLVGAVQDADGLFVSIGTLLAALLVSYLAIAAERMTAVAPKEAGGQSRAQMMALEAAHRASLSRLSGRGKANEVRA